MFIVKVDFPFSLEICDCPTERERFNTNLKSAISDELIVVCGSGASSQLAQRLLKDLSLKPSQLLNVDLNSIENVLDIERDLRNRECTILAIGGGKVCDFSKRLAYLTEQNLILHPTVVSNDGLVSPIAVLSQDGKTHSLPGKMPDHVFIDMDIIRSAPQKFIIAAAFDLLSNFSATADWHYAAERGEVNMNFLAYQFSRIAAYQLLDCASWDISSPEFLRAVIHGQILSAMAMAYAGTSRPCSGSEHLISHAMDELGIATDLLHGEKVGRASLFTLFLQGENTDKMERLFYSFKLKKTLCNEYLDDFTLLSIFSRSRSVRPGRRSVIDKYSDEELLRMYRKFEMKL